MRRTGPVCASERACAGPGLRGRSHRVSQLAEAPAGRRWVNPPLRTAFENYSNNAARARPFGQALTMGRAGCGAITGPPSTLGLGLLSLGRRRPVQIRIRRGRRTRPGAVEVARDVAGAVRVVRRDSELPGEDRDRNPVLSVSGAGDEIAVVDPESIVSRSGAERRSGE